MRKSNKNKKDRIYKTTKISLNTRYSNRLWGLNFIKNKYTIENNSKNKKL